MQTSAKNAKKMIREKAEEMGYRPNLFARTLKTNRSYNIGVLFTDAEHNGLTHDYFAQCWIASRWPQRQEIMILHLSIAEAPAEADDVSGACQISGI